MRGLLPWLLAAGLVALANWARPPAPAAPGGEAAGGPLPPGVAAVSVALGGLNGLLVDFLWLRASNEQEAGRFFDLAQTADWIAMLQPRMAAVYDFQAWNLAFNISSQFSRPEDRWRWVLAGLRLLTGRGQAANPDNPEIAWSVAAILDHKVSAHLDSAHWYYKRQWSDEWSWILGGATPQIERLQAAEVARPDVDRRVQELVAEAAQLGYRLPDELYTWTRPGVTTPTDLAELLRDEAWEEATERLFEVARLTRLREVWGMSPAGIAAVEAAYGPLDWRAAPTHGLYWCRVAQDRAGGPGQRKKVDRLLYQQLWQAFQRGRLVHTAGGELIFATPNIELIGALERELDRAVELFPEDTELPFVRQTFAIDAILALYSFNRPAEARRRYAALQAEHPGEAAYRAPFEQFVLSRLGGLADGNQAETMQVISGLLNDACLWLALDDDGQAAGTVALAGQVHQQYQAREAGIEDGEPLPPFPQLWRHAIDAALGGDLPDDLAGRLRARLSEVRLQAGDEEDGT